MLFVEMLIKRCLKEKNDKGGIMKKFILLIIIHLGILLPAKESINIINPDDLIIKDNKIYILESKLCKVSILDLKTLKEVKSFGKKGKGPGEMVYINGLKTRIDIIDNKIQINNYNKFLIYDLNGNFIKEYKKLPNSIILKGKGYEIFSKLENEDNKNHLNIYCKKKELRKVYSTIAPIQKDFILKGFNPMNQEIFDFKIYKDNLVILDTNGKVILYDLKSNNKKELTINLKGESITKNVKKEVNYYYKNHPTTKMFYKEIKNKFKFPKR